MPEDTPAEARTRGRMAGADRREQLLDVALELFSRQGYERTTVRDIANAADVTDGLIYRYFASKEELLGEVMERARERLSTLPVRMDPERPVAEVLADIVRSLANTIRANLTLVDLQWGEIARGSSVGIQLTSLREDAFQRLAELLSQYTAAGVLAIDNPVLGARMLASAAFSYTCVNRCEPEGAWHDRLEEWANFVSTTFVEGTRAR